MVDGHANPVVAAIEAGRERHGTVLAARIETLWSDELCRSKLDFEPAHDNPTPWIVSLEWTSEYGNPHQADWVTYTWQFLGETSEDAMRDAVLWLEALVPWEPCKECDGQGVWNGVPCADCKQTGLANG